MRLALTVFALGFAAAACGPALDTPPPEEEPSTPFPVPSTPKPPEAKEPTPAKPKPRVVAENDTFAEVVYVFMRDSEFDLWFCTGTLIAKDRVLTAAHCLDPSMFRSYQVVAPLAPNEPRVVARQPKSFGGDFELPENPDIGFLTLDDPIELPQYAELTDVVSRVEGGEALTAAAMVRTAEKPEAPLHMSPQLPLSSTTHLGYAYGFGTPYFSNGGDSGAGLFLVENGKPTHKLIGVARQPEPDRDLDHFTRIGAPFLDWYATNTKGN